jgi:hypothetical protein
MANKLYPAGRNARLLLTCVMLQTKFRFSLTLALAGVFVLRPYRGWYVNLAWTAEGGNMP